MAPSALPGEAGTDTAHASIAIIWVPGSLVLVSWCLDARCRLPRLREVSENRADGGGRPAAGNGGATVVVALVSWSVGWIFFANQF